MEMGGAGSIWRFSNMGTRCTLFLLLEEWKAVSCHSPSCHFQDQHLAASCTRCCCCVFSPPKTDGTRALIMFPTQPPLLQKLAVCSIYDRITCPQYSLCPVNRRQGYWGVQ
jgi:hypothetical protein